MRRALSAVWPSLRYLVAGFGTSIVSWFVLFAVMLSVVLYPAFPYAVLQNALALFISTPADGDPRL